jgi:hypothetical protein
VHEHVAFGVELFGLQNALHRFELRQNGTHEAARIKQVPPAYAIRRQKNPHQLVANSLCADLIDRSRISHKRVPGFFIDLVIEDRGEAHRPEHSQTIFRKSFRWVANCAH